MKKIHLCLALFAAVSPWSTNAQAQSCAATTYSSGGKTVLDQLYESQCAVYSWSSGLITKDFTANCCVQSVWIRINANDWNALAAAGKLDGLRYEKATKDSNDRYTLEFRKISGTTPATISSEDFSK